MTPEMGKRPVRLDSLHGVQRFLLSNLKQRIAANTTTSLRVNCLRRNDKDGRGMPQLTALRRRFHGDMKD